MPARRCAEAHSTVWSRTLAIPWGERDGLGWPLPVAWVPLDERYPGFQDGGWILGDRGPWLDAEDRFTYESTPAPEHSAEAVGESCDVCHGEGSLLAWVQ
jgi:hypothetical protein